MSEEDFKMPPKFTFDEFYEMLKEFVNDSQAREALANYDAELIAGRGQLSESCEGGTNSQLAFESHRLFVMIGWAILTGHGWPTYSEMIESTKKNHELRMQFIDTGNDFIALAKRLIRKTPAYPRGEMECFQDEDFDVTDRAGTLRLLQLWPNRYPQFPANPSEMPFDLTGEQ